MVKNNTLDFNFINSINQESSSLVYIFNEKNKYKNELNYLSQGLFKNSDKNPTAPQVLICKMFGKPFLFYVVDKDLFNEQSFIKTFESFYLSNKEISKQSLWPKDGIILKKEKIDGSINIDIRTIGN